MSSNQLINGRLNKLLSLLSEDENNLQLLIEISDLYLELEDTESAQIYLDQANAIDREATLSHQGILSLKQGHLAEAQQYFSEALTHFDTPELRYNLGFIHFMNSELEQSWEILSPLLEGGHFPGAELLMARILHRQDEIEQAIGMIEVILQHNPDDADALGFLALLHFDLNDEVLAKEISKRALAIDPENYDAQLVNIMLNLMTQEASLEDIENLLKVNPQDSRLWFALGNTYMAQGDLESAKNTLQKAVDIYPGFYDCHMALAWCQLLSNELNAAHETYQNAVELADDIADAWGGLALVYGFSEDLVKAKQLINKANELNPDCFLTELAEVIYSNLQEPQKAPKELVNALQNHELGISEKLSFVIGELQKGGTVH